VTAYRRRGPTERGLAGDLRTTPLDPGAIAHLRAAARLVDFALEAEDVADGARAVRAYLDVRQAYGLAGASREPLDPFAAFVAGLSSPSMGDTPDP
jgi:hypothetical protein